MAKINGQIIHGRPDIIDGFDGFLELFNSEEEAIEFIVGHTYFFHPDVVEQQISAFNKNPPIVVRKASGKDYRKENGEEIKETTSKALNKLGTVYVDGIGIIVDRDGNKKVRDEIKKYTGHIVSEGRSRNTMKNFIITHIWGNTDNPNYFSSMWNFCITPLYAASLTDKDDSDCFCRQLKNLFKAIAIKIYSPGESMRRINHPVDDVSIGAKYDGDKDPLVWAEQLIKDQKINVINENGSVSKITQESNDISYIALERVSTIVKGEFTEKLRQLKDDGIIEELQTIKYCKEKFGLSYPILLPKEERKSRPKHYYKDCITIKGRDYFLCQEWKLYHKENLRNWIEKYEKNNL